MTVHMNVDGVNRQMDIIVDGMKSMNKVLARFGKYMRFKIQKKFDQQGPGWAPLSAHTVAHREHVSASQFERKLKKEFVRAQKKAKNEKTVERRLSVLAEFRRLEAGGRIDASLLPEKQSVKLRQRMQRSKEKSQQILGRMASSITAKVSGGVLTVGSKIPWSGVHNEGGSVGHGATVPKREFLVLEDEDMEALESMFLDQMEAALTE